MLMGYLSYHKANEIISSKVSQVAWQTIQQANRRLELIMNEYDNRSLLILAIKKFRKVFSVNTGIAMIKATIINKSASFVQLGERQNDTLNIYILVNAALPIGSRIQVLQSSRWLARWKKSRIGTSRLKMLTVRWFGMVFDHLLLNQRLIKTINPSLWWGARSKLRQSESNPRRAHHGV